MHSLILSKQISMYELRYYLDQLHCLLRIYALRSSYLCRQTQRIIHPCVFCVLLRHLSLTLAAFNCNKHFVLCIFKHLTRAHSSAPNTKPKFCFCFASIFFATFSNLYKVLCHDLPPFLLPCVVTKDQLLVFLFTERCVPNPIPASLCLIVNMTTLHEACHM